MSDYREKKNVNAEIDSFVFLKKTMLNVLFQVSPYLFILRYFLLYTVNTQLRVRDKGLNRFDAIWQLSIKKTASSIVQVIGVMLRTA